MKKKIRIEFSDEQDIVKNYLVTNRIERRTKFSED